MRPPRQLLFGTSLADAKLFREQPNPRAAIVEDERGVVGRLVKAVAGDNNRLLKR
jgi:hypothetical protein